LRAICEGAGLVREYANSRAGELGWGTQAQDLLRTFVDAMKQKTQKVYWPCKGRQVLTFFENIWSKKFSNLWSHRCCVRSTPNFAMIIESGTAKSWCCRASNFCKDL